MADTGCPRKNTLTAIWSLLNIIMQILGIHVESLIQKVSKTATTHVIWLKMTEIGLRNTVNIAKSLIFQFGRCIT